MALSELPTRPKEPEEVYAEYDENFGWCVFGVNSGFCYASMSTQQEAEQKAEELNKCRNKT